MAELIPEFKQDINTTVDRYFKNVGVYLKPAALSDSVFISLTLGQSRDEFVNGIIHNDPLNISIMLSQLNDNEYEIEYTQRSIGGLKPTEKYFAQGSEKLPARKTRGDKNRILQNIDRFLAKASQRVTELAAEDRFLALPYNPEDKVK